MSGNVVYLYNGPRFLVSPKIAGCALYWTIDDRNDDRGIMITEDTSKMLRRRKNRIINLVSLLIIIAVSSMFLVGLQNTYHLYVEENNMSVLVAREVRVVSKSPREIISTDREVTLAPVHQAKFSNSTMKTKSKNSNARLVSTNTGMYRNTDKKEAKLILWYNHPFWLKRYSKEMDFNKCAVKNCVLTSNIAKAKKSSVILLEQYLPRRAPRKTPGQRWAFMTSEPPPGTGKLYQQKQWHGKFDWMVSYNRKSDIVLPYGEMFRQKTKPDVNYSEVFRQKTKLAVVVNSNCNPLSKRQVYLKELRKYMPVDEYGRCGNMSCTGDRTNQDDRIECHRFLSKKYKFYLAFENSFCEDYTTEKYFNHIRDDNFLVPVVRGAPNIEEYAPKDTYISVKDFKSPRDLAEYLIKVGSNETLFTEYLKRKHEYKTLSEKELYHKALCNICEKIDRDTGEPRVADISGFLQNKCHEPRDLHFR